MEHVENEWLSLHQKIVFQSYKRSDFLKFAQNVQKLEINVNETINKIEELKFMCKGKADCFNDAKNFQTEQKAFITMNTISAGLNLIDNSLGLCSLQVAAFFSQVKLFEKNNKNLASFKKAENNLETVNKEFEKTNNVLVMKSNLETLRNKVEQINNWIINQCDDKQDIFKINKNTIFQFN